MFLLLLGLAAIVFVIYKELWRWRMQQKMGHTQGPRVLPVVGNGHQLGKSPEDLLNFLFDSFYKYGNFQLWIGYYPNIVITDNKDIEYILCSNSLTEKSDMYDVLQIWLGEGLVNSNGSKWHQRRKMITPSFHFKILQDFHVVMNSNAGKFVEKLRARAEGGRIFDFQKMVHNLTLDIMCETAMGVPINAMDNPNSEFVKALDLIAENCLLRMFNPIKRNLDIYRFFPECKRLYRALDVFKDFIYNIIEKRMKMRLAENSQLDSAIPSDDSAKPRHAFLDTMLSATIEGRSLTREEIYEEVSTFMFAGQDTTSSALSFAVLLLSRHLEVQKKVYEEQQLIIGDDLKRDATFQELSEMKYLDMVLKETLRIYPSVPLVARAVKEDIEINNKFIPKGTTLLLFLMSLGYNEDNFPDPYRFDPERFSGLREDQSTYNPFECVPFSAGPRNCVGQKYAILEFKTVISKIIRKFEILPALDDLKSEDGRISTYFGPHKNVGTPPHKYEPKLATVLTLKSANGVLIRLRERK
ncbi:cytochrome P450 4e2-like [Musca domestica]|uniref:Cytochrome P450 4e2-like n=1 Tax=Musca domestica TaxID=7370 RepID=A0ABM3V110_MUSDO|nr:cytochrome P450 4e2-like [Musca domestica]